MFNLPPPSFFVALLAFAAVGVVTALLVSAYGVYMFASHLVWVS